MKRIVVLTNALVFGLLCVGADVETAQAADANLNMVFTTTNAGGSYGNRHVHVIWLETSGGAFVCTVGSSTANNTRAVWANNQASSLTAWWSANAAERSADVDARTGATQTAYQTYNINWNWRRRDGSMVPDGTYRLRFLCTNAESGTPNNSATFTNVTKGNSAWSTGPTTTGGYNNVRLTYTPATLGISNSEATNLTENTATLNGSVDGTGGTNPSVTIYWGDEDGGTNAGSWDNAIALGTRGAGPFSADISGLTPGTTYYFRCYANNGATSTWAAATASFKAVSTTVVFKEGDTWRYVKGYSTPVDWNKLNFDASTWLSGPTGIGYGDNDDATVLTDMENHYWSVYMRFEFNVDAPGSVEKLTFTVDYDDGFAAYINSGEVARQNLPEGAAYNTPASSHEAGTPLTLDLTNHISKLLPGRNVFAIEIHNTTLDSSDLSMIPELTMVGGMLPPHGNIALSTASLDFGKVAVGHSANLSFDIENTGNDVLNVQSITLSGLDKDNYSLVSAPTLPATLAAFGGKATVTIRFAPGGAQDYLYAQAVVGSDDLDEPAAGVNLQGAGTPGATVALNAIGGVGGPCRAVAALSQSQVVAGQGAVLAVLEKADGADELRAVGQVRLAGNIAGIAVSGDIVYAALGASGIAVVDAGDPSRPVVVGRLPSLGHTYDVAARGTTFCAAEGTGGLSYYDGTVPSAPAQTGVYATNGSAAGAAIDGSMAYVLDERLGLRILDLSLLAPITDGLVGWWRLDEAQGAVAVDSLGDMNGSVHGGAGWRPGEGRIDGALEFDGATTYVQIDGYKGIVGGQSRTVSAWIKTTQAGGEIVWWGSLATGTRWALRVNETGELRAEAGGGAIIGTTDLRTGTWRHVAVVLADDGTPNIQEARLYVDGVQETAAPTASQAINTAAERDVQIGVYANGTRYFEGLIDDVRIYDRALSIDEIRNLAPALVGVCPVEFGRALAVSGPRAYVVDRLGGLFVVNISDPAAPVAVGGEIRLAGAGRAIAVSGDRGFVVSDAGVEVLDLTNPDAPASLGVIHVAGELADVAVDGSEVYIAAGSRGLRLWDVPDVATAAELAACELQTAPRGVAANGSLGEILAADGLGLAAFDVSAIRKASLVWASSAGQAQDAAVSGDLVFVAAGMSGMQILETADGGVVKRGEFPTDGFACSVAVSGPVAAVADGIGVYVLDVSNPSSPALLGRWAADGWAGGVAIDSIYVYAANGGRGVAVLNAADASLLRTVDTDGVAHGVAVAGGKAYVANGTRGLAVYDLAPLPEEPVRLGSFDTPGIATDVTIVGTRACVADGSGGVSIVDVSVPARPLLYARNSRLVRALATAESQSRLLTADDSGGLAILAAQPWPGSPFGDLDGDHAVILGDLINLAGNWLENESMLDVLIGNLNDDTAVNLADFAVLAGNWMTEQIN